MPPAHARIVHTTARCALGIALHITPGWVFLLYDAQSGVMPPAHALRWDTKIPDGSFEVHATRF